MHAGTRVDGRMTERMNLLQLTTYAAIVFFVIAVVVKIVRIARLPVHLRWDLYPIPHEKGKSSYGGSYFEDPSWWRKPREKSLWAEMREMAVEIFLLRGVFRNNRSLWCFSYPFHIGLYALVGLIVCLKLSTLFLWAGMPLDGPRQGWWPVALFDATLVLAALGWTLTVIGSLGLLAMRLLTPDLRTYSRPSDYINLFFLLAVSGIGLFAWVTVDRDCAALRTFIAALASFRPLTAPLPTATTVLLWLTDLLLVYFPFTHMTHFAGKFFTYHTVRWADAPYQRGTRLDRRLTDAAGFPVSWTGPHIDPSSTWKQAAENREKTDDRT